MVKWVQINTDKEKTKPRQTEIKAKRCQMDWITSKVSSLLSRTVAVLTKVSAPASKPKTLHFEFDKKIGALSFCLISLKLKYF